MLQAWGRVLLAKVRVRTVKREYRQQALDKHLRAKCAARIQLAFRSPERLRPSPLPLLPFPSSRPSPLSLLPLPAIDARRAALLYSASPTARPTARPNGCPSLPKPSPERAQCLKLLMAQGFPHGFEGAALASPNGSPHPSHAHAAAATRSPPVRPSLPKPSPGQRLRPKKPPPPPPPQPQDGTPAEEEEESPAGSIIRAAAARAAAARRRSDATASGSELGSLPLPLPAESGEASEDGNCAVM